MRAYALKRRGKSIWQNMILDNTITFSNKDAIYCGLLFLRKKDAKKYLDSLEVGNYYEVIGMTVDKSRYDNRKSIK